MRKWDQVACCRPGDNEANLPVKPIDVLPHACVHPLSMPEALIGHLLAQYEAALRRCIRPTR
jgi:hypothetical protein